MKTRRAQITVLLKAVVCSLIVAAVAAGQTTAKPAAAPKALIPLKIDVVFNEYEGAKKVSSLPYTLSVNANALGPSQRTSLRVGLRVPVVTGRSFYYQDMGTQIDCSAESRGEGLYQISLSLRRSSLYSPLGVQSHRGLFEFPEKTPPSQNKDANPAPESHRIAVSARPIITSFSTDLKLLMRNAQTIEGLMATDPVSGRVLKVNVTLHAVNTR